MKVVVTGNIGAGKSAAVQLLMPQLTGFTLFDYDQSVHDVYDDAAVQMHLEMEFGTGERSKLSDLAFTDPVLRTRLAKLINTHVMLRIEKMTQVTDVLFDIPLYFDYEGLFQPAVQPDITICVAADRKIRFERVKQRNDWSDDKIRSVMDLQMSDADKMSKADVVMFNNTTKGALVREAERVADVIHNWGNA